MDHNQQTGGCEHCVACSGKLSGLRSDGRLVSISKKQYASAKCVVDVFGCSMLGPILSKAPLQDASACRSNEAASNTSETDNPISKSEASLGPSLSSSDNLHDMVQASTAASDQTNDLVATMNDDLEQGEHSQETILECVRDTTNPDVTSAHSEHSDTSAYDAQPYPSAIQKYLKASTSTLNRPDLFQLDCPCKCSYCSNIVWPVDGMFRTTTRHEVLKESPLSMGAEVVDITIRVADVLKARGNRLRKRWHKKKPQQRASILQKTCPDLHSAAHFEKRLRSSYSHHGTPFTTSGAQPYTRSGYDAGPAPIPEPPQEEDGFILYVQDDLYEDADTIFGLMHTRCSLHPAAFFLEDFMQIRSRMECHTSYPNPFSLGMMGTAIANYGDWASWDTETIHQGRAFPAFVAAMVLGAQYETMKMFEELLNELQNESGHATSQDKPLPDLSTFALPNESSLLSLANTIPIYSMNLAYYPEMILEFAVEYKDIAMQELSMIRSDNRAFLDRIRQGQELNEFCNLDKELKQGLLVLNVLAELPDRTFWWTHFMMPITKYLQALKNDEAGIMGADAFRLSWCATLLSGLESRRSIITLLMRSYALHLDSSRHVLPIELNEDGDPLS
ncbi:hypothetical protein LTR66_017714, partial [Elasticomyces elasticus]